MRRCRFHAGCDSFGTAKCFFEPRDESVYDDPPALQQVDFLSFEFFQCAMKHVH